MIIAVFSGKIDTHNVCTELLNRGLLTIATSRTHAMQIAHEVEIALGIDTESEEDPHLIHLSTDVDELGWFDFLIYSKAYVYEPCKTQEMVRIAVRNWISAGSPDVNYAKVAHRTTLREGCGDDEKLKPLLLLRQLPP